MQIGMLTYELERPTLDSLMEAIRNYGYTCIQLVLTSVYGEEITLKFDGEMAQKLRSMTQERGIDIVAVNGTFNMSHPDKKMREEGLKCLERIASLCSILDCNLVTVCTGSRSNNMWQWHPDNTTEQAWNDMLWTMRQAVATANKYNVYLGIEIEQSNVVNSADAALRLFEEINDPCLKIIMDGANILPSGNLSPDEVKEIFKYTFEKVGKHIILAHGKDLKKGDGLTFTSAGKGIVDFDYFLQLFREYGCNVPMVLHGINNESEFSAAYSFIKDKIDAANI